MPVAARSVHIYPRRVIITTRKKRGGKVIRIQRATYAAYLLTEPFFFLQLSRIVETTMHRIQHMDIYMKIHSGNHDNVKQIENLAARKINTSLSEYAC